MIIINGDFFCNELTGIERLAFELTQRLDLISKKDEIGIVIPKNTKNVPVFKNIKKIMYKKNITSFPRWQQFIFPFFLLKYKAVPLDFGNSCSFLCPGITFLHDIYCEIHPEDFISAREKLECVYFRLLYRIIACRAKIIITVSNTSKKQIVEKFHVNPEKVRVIHSSYDHFKSITADASIINKFPVLSKPFYFALGSLSKRKNLKWIIEYAGNHPDKRFAVSGVSLNTVKADEINRNEIPPNVIFLGYVSDSNIKYLMEKCAAFILPSYYEGFGLTPLEALSCGAQIIVSNAASLPEIYGNAAHYIDPFNYDTNIDDLLLQPVDSPVDILKKYSFDKSAAQLYEVIKECII
jgi:glycosyltransferase involved in cell wall biosynthesis